MNKGLLNVAASIAEDQFIATSELPLVVVRIRLCVDKAIDMQDHVIRRATTNSIANRIAPVNLRRLKPGNFNR